MAATSNETISFPDNGPIALAGGGPIALAGGGGGPIALAGESREKVGFLCGNTREKRFEIVDMFNKEVHIR